MRKIGLLAFSFLTGILMLTGFSFFPVPITDVHEHIESMQRAEALLSAMKARGVERTLLLPSPRETLTLNGAKTFTGYQENMDQILKIAEAFPKKLIPFCTVSPLEADALEIFKDCVGLGGKGLKLYNGHSFYYDTFKTTLDDPVMDPIYAFAEENNLPILYHVNIMRYGPELENVLKKYPRLRVTVPHFMVSSNNLKKVEELLARYPNLFTDISFGYDEFMAAGFRRISKKTKEFKNFIERFPDQILFGADMVLTDLENKDALYMKTILKCYRDLLEKSRFTCKPVPEYYRKNSRKDKNFIEWAKETKTLRGLTLSKKILKKIYQENPQKFLGI